MDARLPLIRPESRLSLQSIEGGRRYLLLFSLQTIGALIFLRYALPLYRAAVANPAAHEARLGPLIWGSTAVALMQAGFWIRHWLRPPPPRFRQALIGYVMMFLTRMSFVLATSIFGFVFITRRPEFYIPASRYLLLLVGLFAFYCYTQETERLGKSLIDHER